MIIPAWRSISPTWESPSDLGFDFEYSEEQQDEEDTSADDSVSYIVPTSGIRTETGLKVEFSQNWMLHHSFHLYIVFVIEICVTSTDQIEGTH